MNTTPNLPSALMALRAGLAFDRGGEYTSAIKLFQIRNGGSMRTFQLLTFVMLAASAVRGDSTTAYIVTDLEIETPHSEWPPCVNFGLAAINHRGSVIAYCENEVMAGILLWTPNGRSVLYPLSFSWSPWLDFELVPVALSENNDIVTLPGDWFQPGPNFGVVSPNSGGIPDPDNPGWSWQLMDEEQVASLPFGDPSINEYGLEICPGYFLGECFDPSTGNYIAGYLYTPASERARVPEPASWLMFGSVIAFLVFARIFKALHVRHRAVFGSTCNPK